MSVHNSSDMSYEQFQAFLDWQSIANTHSNRSEVSYDKNWNYVLVVMFLLFLLRLLRSDKVLWELVYSINKRVYHYRNRNNVKNCSLLQWLSAQIMLQNIIPINSASKLIIVVAKMYSSYIVYIQYYYAFYLFCSSGLH